jgi:hypothetical protein
MLFSLVVRISLVKQNIGGNQEKHNVKAQCFFIEILSPNFKQMYFEHPIELTGSSEADKIASLAYQ